MNPINRLGGVIMDPNFTEDDLGDIVKAIRKVYHGHGHGLAECGRRI